MSALTNTEVLFIGAGRSPICWYRAAMPAIYLGCDWVGVDDSFNVGAGMVRGAMRMPNFDDYKVIIWQQPRSPFHIQMMKDFQKAGKKVIIDCDDYLEGVRKSKDHDFKDAPAFSKKEMDKWQKTMSIADGMIVSTEWLRNKYVRHNKNIWVCKNGLDLGRYMKDRSYVNGVNIGWAGATGHVQSFLPVMDALHRIMVKYPYVNFVSIGQPFANDFLQAGIDPQRVVAIPWTSIELYPNAMTMFDVALAPARESGWYKAKSQLRYYEAAAVGAATLGTAWLYDEIIDGVTGYKIHSDEEWFEKMEHLVTHHDERRFMQRMSRHVASESFDMNHRKTQWVQVLEDLAREIREEEESKNVRSVASRA